MLRVIVLLIAVSTLACGGKETGEPAEDPVATSELPTSKAEEPAGDGEAPSCAEVAAAVVAVPTGVTAPAERDSIDEIADDSLRKAIEDQCEHLPMPESERRCLARARTLDDLEACRK